MAIVNAIFQPLTGDGNHAEVISTMLDHDWLTDVTLSSAFANFSGVSSFADQVTELSDCCQIFIGIRNGSTTAQAIAALLKTGAAVYVVDTAMRGRIFHPKVHFVKGGEQAIAIIGSANLTHAGLNNNIEAGCLLELDLTDESDQKCLEIFELGFAKLVNEFPEHCFQITSLRQVVQLMHEGLLENERDPKTRSASGVGQQGANTAKPRIPLPFVKPKNTSRIKRRKPPVAVQGAPMSSIPHYGNLVWMKPSLPTGDLQLLAVGNASGVVRLTQAKFEVNGAVIDQTRYFRYDVFGGLKWTIDPNDPGKQIAFAPFALVIAGVYVGDFDLQLSHKPAWEAGQGNYTTGLHWHDATPHIRKPGLIGRTLKLYEPSLPNHKFIIEID